MNSLPVTLVVKAPNQQIEDQTVQCELSWTIQKLKQHLSEVYPSKPPKHEQKLIYSGQLLNDSLTLKDVLRHFEGQETHTVHLVCSPKFSKSVQDESASQKPKIVDSTNNVNANASQPQANSQGQSSHGLPQPNMLPQNINWENFSRPLNVVDPNQYAAQLVWMQQAYFQYITQYMNLAASSYNGAAPQPIIPPQATAAPAPVPGPQAEPNRPAPAAPQNAPARDPDNNQERDWLDIFYMLSRAMVLFSVVYFYSSPMRFIFVLILGIGLYLYQVGFFRNLNNNNLNNAPQEGQVAEEEQAPSRLMVIWTFFATFFASLIPELPNAV